MIIEKFEPSDEIKIILRNIIYQHKENWLKINDGRSSLKKFNSLEVPKRNKNTYSLKTYILDSPLLENVKKLLDADTINNNIMYPKNSIMGWHTNSKSPGERTYISFSKKPGIFRYKNPETGEIIDDYDNELWTGRRFVITEKPLFWHTIYAPERRFSFGFNKLL